MALKALSLIRDSSIYLVIKSYKIIDRNIKELKSYSYRFIKVSKVDYVLLLIDKGLSLEI